MENVDAIGVQKVLNSVGPDELIRVAVDMGHIYGPAGYEADVGGGYIYRWFR